MKRLTLLLTFLLIFSYINAQNWQPVSQGLKYNYGFSNNNSYISIWIDSTKTIANDTIRYFNKTSKVVKVNEYQNSLYVNQNTFLLSQFYMNQDTIRFYDSKFKTTFKLIRNDTSSFVFDPINKISAHCISINDSVLFGNVIDSINVFILSNADTVIISKNHGIIKFPLFKNHLHVNLLGIQNLLGLQIPQFKDLFDFNIGDSFEYDIQWGGRFAGDYKTVTRKIEISQKSYNVDTLKYICNVKEKITFINSVYKNDTSYTNKISNIKFVNYSNSFSNKYPGDFVLVSDVYAIPVAVYYDDKYKSICKSFGRSYNRSGEDKDQYSYSMPYTRDLASKFPIYLEDVDPVSYYNYDFFSLTYLYAEGLGVVKKERSTFNSAGPSHYSYQMTLTGAKTKTRTYGSFKEDSFYTNIENKLMIQNVSVFPNPVSDFLFLENTSQSTDLMVSVLNVNGQVLLNRKIGGGKSMIDMSKLSKGIYLVKINGDQSIVVKSIIKN